MHYSQNFYYFLIFLVDLFSPTIGSHTLYIYDIIIAKIHLIKDTVICDDSNDTRTHKVFRALETIAYQFDLGKPVWFDITVNEFKKYAKARFYQDNFIETIDFDFLEIQVLEEDMS